MHVLLDVVRPIPTCTSLKAGTLVCHWNRADKTSAMING